MKHLEEQAGLYIPSSEKKFQKCHRLEVANWLSRESNPKFLVKHL
ncbi:MAG: hypothetical protein ACFFAU_18530 [Candidatus Hodarchaeota archaeon]